jgi:ABC-2 type transport system permease protein
VKLFLSQLKTGRAGLLTWAILVLLYGLFAVYLYPTITNSSLDYVSYIASLPEALRAAMGLGNLDMASLSYTLDTFVAVEFVMFWPIIVCFYAIFGGVSLSREAERGTLDLLLAQPVSRTRVLLTRFASLITGVLVIGIASWAGIALGLPLIDQTPVNLGNQALALALGALMVLAIGGYTVLFNVIFLEPRKALTAAGGLTAVMYIINFIVPVLSPSLSWVRQLSFFYHFNAVEIARTGGLNGTAVAIYGVTFCLTIIAATIIFERRNLSN